MRCDTQLCSIKNIVFPDKLINILYVGIIYIPINRTVKLISVIACSLLEVTIMELNYTEYELSQNKEANVICLPQQSGTVNFSHFINNVFMVTISGTMS